VCALVIWFPKGEKKVPSSNFNRFQRIYCLGSMGYTTSIIQRNWVQYIGMVVWSSVGFFVVHVENVLRLLRSLHSCGLEMSSRHSRRCAFRPLCFVAALHDGDTSLDDWTKIQDTDHKTTVKIFMLKCARVGLWRAATTAF
jgi:hypothetical protein